MAMWQVSFTKIWSLIPVDMRRSLTMWTYGIDCKCYCWVNVCTMWWGWEWIPTFWFFIYHCRNAKALTLDWQKVVINGRPSLYCSAADWEICYEWKNGFTSWVEFKCLKESPLVQVADYAVAHSIDQEPVFNFCVGMSWKSIRRLFFWSVREMLHFSRRPTSLALRCQKLFRRQMHLIRTMKTPCGLMEFRRKWI